MNCQRILLLALALPALVAQTPTEIRLGTWNIEFLGADGKFRRDTPPRDGDDLVAIGNKIRDLGVALLAVQEICGERPLRAVADAAGPGWRPLLGTTGQWSDGKTQQGVGLLYDAEVVDLLHAEELLELPSNHEDLSVFHRKPVTACFRHRETGCDFRVVVVHFKAGTRARDRLKRLHEATLLRAWIDGLLATAGEDQDLVLLGDFNSGFGDQPEQVFERDGAMQYLEHRSPAATIMHFDKAIDQICVARGFDELQRHSAVVHGVRDERQRRSFRKTYSDHFPVTVTLRARGDDDPQATFRRGPARQWLPVTERPTPNATRDTTASGGQARSARTADDTWPPKVGTTVEVVTNGRVYRGPLLQPIPERAGWVVIRHDGHTTAVRTERIDVLKLRD